MLATYTVDWFRTKPTDIKVEPSRYNKNSFSIKINDKFVLYGLRRPELELLVSEIRDVLAETEEVKAI